MHSVSFVFDGSVFTIMFSGYSLAWHVPQVFRDGPAAHNQREAATVENSTSATPVTTCGAMRIKRGTDRGDSVQAF
jgi:hypothetical protein